MVIKFYLQAKARNRLKPLPHAPVCTIVGHYKSVSIGGRCVNTLHQSDVIYCAWDNYINRFVSTIYKITLYNSTNPALLFKFHDNCARNSRIPDIITQYALSNCYFPLNYLQLLMILMRLHIFIINSMRVGSIEHEKNEH